MLRIAPVDTGEVPRTSNQLGVALAGAGPGLEQEKRFNIHRSVGEQGALFGHRVRGDPNAVLKVAEAAALEISPEFVPRAAPDFGHVEQDQAPATVPPPAPAGLRVTSTERLETARL